MADHALVVGCDAYPNVPGGDLRGAVGDALAMYAWLVDVAGTPAGNVTLLLSGSSAGERVPGGPTSGPADRSRFAAEFTRLITTTDVDGDRLYVYFAGHGCRNDPLNPALATDVLAFTGFVGTDPPAGTIGVDELLRKLRLSHFRDVVVVLDACRDFPFKRRFTVGGMGFDPDTPGPRTPDLYLLQATQPGWQARGDQTPDGVRGRLTGAVLDGLAGIGAAKRYVESAHPPYAVTWSSLVSYIKGTMADQDPHDEGAARDPVLARFAEDHFDPVRLTVDVRPSESAAASDLRVQVSYWDPAEPDDRWIARPGPTPTRFTVPPRRQVVKATHGTAWNRVPVDVYADQQITIVLDGSGRLPAPKQTESSRGAQAGAGVVRVTADDPFAAIEVRTLTVPARAVGAGLSQYSGDLLAGQYLVLATDADGRERWEPLDVVVHYETELHLTLPRPRGNDDLLGPSPWAGPAAVLAYRHGPGFEDGFVCLIGGDAPEPSEVLARRQHGPAVPVNNSSRVAQRFVADPSTEVLEFRFGEHRLEVSAVTGLTAVLLFAKRELRVSYFDSKLIRDENALLVMDRAQRLMAAGRDRAARIVLGRRLPHSVVASRLSAHPPVGERHRLPNSPWGVYLDRPLHKPGD